MRHILLTIALSGLVAAPAAAQQLTLEFNAGLVTIDAAGVPVRTILNEWAKRGGTKVIGGERISGAPLTVKLVDVPEAKALEVILRSVAGYMAAPRSTGPGASVYDRILVMATSSAPPPAAAAARPAPANPNAMAGTQRFVPPQRDTDEDVKEDEEDPNPPNPPSPPVFTFPGATVTPNPGQFQQPGQMQPMIVNPQTGQAQPATTVTPVMPGGYTMPVPGGAPGSINAPPVQPGQPGVVTRPPGRQRQ
jgi:hypothetical protein